MDSNRIDWGSVLLSLVIISIIIFMFWMSSVSAYTPDTYTLINATLSDSPYAPDLYTLINVTLDAVGGGVTGNTCTTFGSTGIITCSDNCTVSTNTNMNNKNLTLSGNGIIIISANITGIGEWVMMSSSCQIYCSGGCFKV